MWAAVVISLAWRRRAISYGDLVMRHVSIASRKACWSSGLGGGGVEVAFKASEGRPWFSRDKICFGESEARWDGRSGVWRTASTSYLASASSEERGKPDHITLSGSRGGRKRVNVEVGIW